MKRNHEMKTKCKLTLNKETLRALAAPQFAEVRGGRNWTDGWCDLTLSGGDICASLAGHCQTR